MRKISIVNMQKDIEHLAEMDGITGISCEGAGGGNTSAISNITERTALWNIEERDSLKKRIKRAQLELDSIDRALEGLTEVKREIIKNKYLEGLPWWEVAYSVGYGERHCKRLRTEAINELADGIYGCNSVIYRAKRRECPENSPI